MKVLVSDKLHEKAMEKLRSMHEVTYEEVDPETLLTIIRDYDAIIVRSRTKVTSEVIERGEKLKVIGRAGIGVDNIDVKKATEKGIPVVNAPTGSTISVAELAIGHMISVARYLPQSDRSVRAGRWEKKRFLGTELSGKVLGFIGLGRIGSEVAKRARAFGMECFAYDPYISKEKAKELGAELLDDLDTLLERSDFITIHALLTDETRGLVGEEQLKRMKRTAYLINCARGGIVDESALAKALREGWIAGAALDVFEKEPPAGSPLLQLENVVFTPHLGASTREGQERAGTIVVEQVDKVLRGEKPDFVVNREIYS